MIALAVVVVAGALVLDVALDVWRRADGVRRVRERDRNRVAMRRTIDRTGGPRP